MNTKTKAYIKTLSMGARFILSGDGRANIPPMTVEGITSEGGRTVVRYRYDGGARGQFVRPSMTMVTVIGQ